MAVVKQKKAFRGRIRGHYDVAFDALTAILNYQTNHATSVNTALQPSDISTLGDALAIVVFELNRKVDA